jgi:hypothetical protein
VLAAVGERHDHRSAMINPDTGFSAHDSSPSILTGANQAILFFILSLPPAINMRNLKDRR